MAKFISNADTLDYTPSAAVAAGDVIVVGGRVHVATQAIAANTLGAVRAMGVCEFPKADGAGEAIAGGVIVYWDATNSVATDEASGNVRIGYAVPAGATDADTVVRVDLQAL